MGPQIFQCGKLSQLTKAKHRFTGLDVSIRTVSKQIMNGASTNRLVQFENYMQVLNGLTDMTSPHINNIYELLHDK